LYNNFGYLLQSLCEVFVPDCTPTPISEVLDCNALLQTLIAFKKGDFSVGLPVTEVGIAGKIADTLNDILEMNGKVVAELERNSTSVGKEGRVNQQATMPRVGVVGVMRGLGKHAD
jgi:hypothetical protein